MLHKNVWIEVARDWIEVAVVARSRVRRIRRFLCNPGETAHSTTGGTGSHPIPPNLRHNIAEGLSLHNAPRSSVHVIWHTAGSWVDAHSVQTPPAAAPGAATLAFCAANALDRETWLTSARVIASRTRDDGVSESSVLVSAMRREILAEIEHAVEDGGATLKGVIPAHSFALLQTVDDSIQASQRHKDPTVTIHVGEETICMAIARSGSLLMVRTIEMGISNLREAYLRAMEPDGAEYHQAFSHANERLFEGEGIPSPKAESTDAIIVFQKARTFLQRFMIEVKQTVRFTIDEDELDSTNVRLIGPGASIPRLAPMLSEETGFTSVEAAAPGCAVPELGSGIDTALRLSPTTLAIQPPGRMESVERSARRAAMLFGAVAAALLLAGDTLLAHRGATIAENRIRSLEERIDEWSGRFQSGLGANPRELASNLETLIQSEAALQADWGVALAEIVASREDDVWLTSVSGERSRDGSFLSLEAITRPADGKTDPHAAIASFIEALQASALVTEAVIGGTELLQMDEGEALQFRIMLGLNEVQAPWFTAEVSP